MTRLGTDLARLMSAASQPTRLHDWKPIRVVARLDRYRLAWYSARKGRMVLRANIVEALKPHRDQRYEWAIESLPDRAEIAALGPRWCDCCGVPYPCHTRRMLTRPPMEADS